ncbi:MAG: YeeE/YedE family protein [Litoreibacter sp.]|nr:YeeE/YedE family protein [Litoreibacter sp.]
MEVIADWIGDTGALFALGLVVGLVFGSAAQHSRFCLRAATVEVAHGQLGPKMAIWLIVFLTALLATQLAHRTGYLDPSEARQLSGIGSLSGAILGGLLFGVGMILARGCASRLLVLSATGNMRALVTGLVLTLVAQASLRGVFAPVREGLFNLWTIDGEAARNLLDRIGGEQDMAIATASVLLVAAFGLAVLRQVPRSRVVAAGLVGLAVAGGWVGTYALAQVSFTPVALSSVTFSGPSADTLMGLVNERSLALSFSIGLIPGVMAGSGLTALATGEFRIERFSAETGMERYLLGACMMGFGSMLAGGCAVGAGVSGGAVFSLTAWVAVFSMWIGALAAITVSDTLAQGRGAGPLRSS